MSEKIPVIPSVAAARSGQAVRGLDTNTFAEPSFGLGNRLARLVWKTTWLFLGRTTPAPFFAWRNLLLRLFGASLGQNVHIYPAVDIWAPWNLCCGDNVGIGNRAIVYNQAAVTIGSRVVISQGVHLCTGTHDYESRNFRLYAKPIRMEDHAWLAAESFIGPGVVIGEGAVVAARSVVVKSIAPWHIVGGNPAKNIKVRRRPEEWS